MLSKSNEATGLKWYENFKNNFFQHIVFYNTFYIANAHYILIYLMRVGNISHLSCWESF